MTKSILVSFAVLALSTSAALAAQRTYHHRDAVNAGGAYASGPHVAGPYAGGPYAGGPYAGGPYVRGAYASMGAPPVGPVGWQRGMNSSDYTNYMRNLHDSGYDPKNDYNSNGIISTQ